MNASQIEFTCDCGREFRVDRSRVGKRGRCPECKVGLVVPAPADELGRDSASNPNETDDPVENDGASVAEELPRSAGGGTLRVAAVAVTITLIAGVGVGALVRSMQSTDVETTPVAGVPDPRSAPGDAPPEADTVPGRRRNADWDRERARAQIEAAKQRAELARRFQLDDSELDTLLAAKRAESVTASSLSEWQHGTKQVQLNLAQMAGQFTYKVYQRSLCYGPGGRHLAYVGDDLKVSLWDVQRGTRVLHVEGGGSVAFSPDGKRVVFPVYKTKRVQGLVHNQTTLEVRDIQGGGLVREFPIADKHVWPLIQVTSTNRLVCQYGIWDLASGQRVDPFPHKLNKLPEELAFSSDGRRYFYSTGGETGFTGLVASSRISGVSEGRRQPDWSVDPQKDLAVTRRKDIGADRLIASMTLSPDDRTLGVCFDETLAPRLVRTSDGEGRILELRTPDGRPLPTDTDNFSSNAIHFSPDGRHAAVILDHTEAPEGLLNIGRAYRSEFGRSVPIVRLADGEIVAVLHHEAAVYHVAFSPNGDELACVTSPKGGPTRVVRWSIGLGTPATGQTLALLRFQREIHGRQFLPPGETEERISDAIDQWFVELLERAKRDGGGGMSSDTEPTAPGTKPKNAKPVDVLITGRIVDQFTKAPLSGVELEFVGDVGSVFHSFRVTTKADGTFRCTERLYQNDNVTLHYNGRSLWKGRVSGDTPIGELRLTP